MIPQKKHFCFLGVLVNRTTIKRIFDNYQRWDGSLVSSFKEKSLSFGETLTRDYGETEVEGSTGVSVLCVTGVTC